MSRRWMVSGGPLAAISFGFVLALGALVGCGGQGNQNRNEGRNAANEGGGTETTATEADSIIVTGGLETPESVLWDRKADIYIVSNVNGDPLAKDDNGFLSRISPEGRIEKLKWIEGGSPGVRLNAPKGLAIVEDTLYVADIDTVRAFHRVSGQPLGARGVPGATFLNDVAPGADGTIFVTDSGLGPGFKPSGTDAIYRFEGIVPVPVAAGPDLQSPNGILAEADSVTFVTFGADKVDRVASRTDTPTAVRPRLLDTTPTGQLDGIVRLPDGSFLVSSWAGRAVYRVPSDGGEVETVVEGVTSPADIGWDEQRHRVLIPVFLENRVIIRKIG